MSGGGRFSRLRCLYSDGRFCQHALWLIAFHPVNQIRRNGDGNKRKNNAQNRDIREG